MDAGRKEGPGRAQVLLDLVASWFCVLPTYVHRCAFPNSRNAAPGFYVLNAELSPYMPSHRQRSGTSARRRGARSHLSYGTTTSSSSRAPLKARKLTRRTRRPQIRPRTHIRKPTWTRARTGSARIPNHTRGADPRPRPRARRAIGRSLVWQYLQRGCTTWTRRSRCRVHGEVRPAPCMFLGHGKAQSRSRAGRRTGGSGQFPYPALRFSMASRTRPPATCRSIAFGDVRRRARRGRRVLALTYNPAAAIQLIEHWWRLLLGMGFSQAIPIQKLSRPIVYRTRIAPMAHPVATARAPF